MAKAKHTASESIHVITERISREDVKAIAQETFAVMVKGVVDVEKHILALGGELHADGNAELLEQGSRQQDLWGINLYPHKPRAQRIEYIALINIRPAGGNPSMQIKSARIRKRIEDIVNELVE